VVTHKIVVDDTAQTASVLTSLDEPTPEIIAGALTNAKRLFTINEHFTLLRALAEATTTEQCRGIQGFKVFRDVQAAVTKVLPPTTTLPAFNDTAQRDRVVEVLDKAIEAVSA